MIFYHVSSYVSEYQKLTRKSKNNRCICEYISNCSNESYQNYQYYYNELKGYHIKDISGRDAEKWISEAIFDGVRKKYYINKPSRIWGIFLSDSFTNAKEFLLEHRDPQTSHIYEVDIPYNVCGFDMSFFSKADEKIRDENFSVDSYHYAVRLAKDYWKQAIKNRIDEYIVDDEITIGKRVL